MLNYTFTCVEDSTEIKVYKKRDFMVVRAKFKIIPNTDHKHQIDCYLTDAYILVDIQFFQKYFPVTKRFEIGQLFSKPCTSRLLPNT